MAYQLTRAQRASLACDRNIMVLAGAGTGKTRALTERVLFLITEKRVRPSELLVLTFTRKAASEMKERIYNRLLEAYFKDPANHHLEQAVHHFNEMVINTFHGFFASLLRNYGYSIGMNHQFKVMEEEPEQQLLFRKAFLSLLDQWGHEYPDKLTDLFTYYTYNELKKVSTDILRDWVLFKSTLDFYRELGILTNEKFDSDRFQKIFTVKPDIDWNQLVTRFEKLLEAAYNEAVTNTKSTSKILMALRQSLPPLLQYLKSEKKEEEKVKELVVQLSNLSVNGKLSSLFTREGLLNKGRIPRRLAELFEDFNHKYINFLSQYNLNPIQLKNYFLYSGYIPSDSDYFKLLTHWLSWGEKLISLYEEYKKVSNQVDFHDLEIFSRKLFREAPHIVEKLRNQFRYVMVDEFQDTNSLQWELLFHIVSDGRRLSKDKLFIVGDKKQAIYGFRGGEVEICDLAERMIRDVNKENQKNMSQTVTTESDKTEMIFAEGIIPFVENFRSHPDLLNFFNRFGNIIFPGSNPEPFDTTYFPLRAGMKEKTSVGKSIFYGFYVTEEKDEVGETIFKLSAPERREVEARNIARFLRLVLDEKWNELASFLGMEPEEVRRQWLWLATSMRSGKKSVGLLFRRKANLPIYEKALIDYGLPFKMESGQSLFQQQEIVDLLHLLNWLHDPADDISLIGFARSIIWGISDLLITFISLIDSSGRSSFYEKMEKIVRYLDHRSIEKEKELISLGELFSENFNQFKKLLPIEWQNKVLENLPFPTTDWKIFMYGFEQLKKLKKLSSTLPVFALFVEIVQRFQLMELYKQLPDGEQKLANLREFMDILNNFVVENSAADFSSLMMHLELLIQNSNIGLGETDEDAVIQVMTVHKSKGLEFPLVILADLEKESGSGSFKKRDILLMEKMVFEKPWKDGHGWEFPELHSFIPEAYEKEKRFSVIIPRSRKIEEDSFYFPLEEYAFLKDEFKEYAEERRLLYVAMTRAEMALMIFTGVEDIHLPEKRDRVTTISTWQEILLQPFEKIAISQKEFVLTESFADLAIHSFPIPSQTAEMVKSVDEKQFAGEERISISFADMKKIYHPSELGSNDFNETEKRNFNIPVTEFGTIVHEAMERDYWQKNDAELEQILKNREPLLESTEVSEIIRHIRKAQMVIQAMKKNYPQLYKEVPFYSPIIPEENIFMKGVIDGILVAPDQKKAVILDYKTNFVEFPDKEYARKHGYDLQLAVYSKIAEEIMNVVVEKAVLIFTHSGHILEYPRNDWLKQFEKLINLIRE
jgi:ATP-dependent helicase/nuclease subunit A